jgi:hypothetical protein
MLALALMTSMFQSEFAEGDNPYKVPSPANASVPKPKSQLSLPRRLTSCTDTSNVSALMRHIRGVTLLDTNAEPELPKISTFRGWLLKEAEEDARRIAQIPARSRA